MRASPPWGEPIPTIRPEPKRPRPPLPRWLALAFVVVLESIVVAATLVFVITAQGGSQGAQQAFLTGQPLEAYPVTIVVMVPSETPLPTATATATARPTATPLPRCISGLSSAQVCRAATSVPTPAPVRTVAPPTPIPTYPGPGRETPGAIYLWADHDRLAKDYDDGPER